MSGSPRNIIDPSGRYASSIISKNGRNEVQIYQLAANPTQSHDLIEESRTVKVELQADETIVDAVWYSSSDNGNEADAAARKRTKRRASGGEESHHESSVSINLAVLIESGEILVLTPYSDKIVVRIPNSTDNVLSGLVAGQDASKSSLWAYSSSPAVFYEVATDRNQIVKSVALLEENAIHSAVTLDSRGVSITIPKTAFPVLVGAQEAHYVDLARTAKKAKLNTFPPAGESPASIIKQSSIKGDKVFVLRDNQVSLYSLNPADKTISTFEVAPSTIYNIQLVASSDQKQEVLFAVTSEGIQSFSIDYDSEQKNQTPTSLIRTTFHEDEIVFSNVWYNQNTQQLAGVWYNSNEPKFVGIDWNFNSVGEIQVPIEYTPKPAESVTKRKGAISIPKQGKINNLEAEELHKKLEHLLSEASEENVLTLLYTHNEQSAIKHTIKQLSVANSNGLLNRLFQIVSAEVGLDPSKKSTLAVWLKWILLTHGGALGRDSTQVEALKDLQSGLDSGLKLMPHLLALQGRLQLLKSQAQLRQNGSQLDDEDSEIENETQLQLDREDQEQDIVFANGENDEEDEEDEEGEILKKLNEGDEEDDE